MTLRLGGSFLLAALFMALWWGPSASVANSSQRCEYSSPYRCVAAKEKACGKVGVWTEGIRSSARVFAKGVSCRKARSVINGGTRGWKGVTGSGEGSLYIKRGVKRVGVNLGYGKYIRSSNVVRRSRVSSSALRARPASRTTFRKINKAVRRWSKNFYCPSPSSTRVSSRNGNWAVVIAVNNCGGGSGFFHIFLRKRAGKWEVRPNLTTVGRADVSAPCAKKVVPADIRCRIKS